MKRNHNCKRCVLSESSHLTTCLMGAGNPNADLMLIGEAPGFDEDRHGSPFIGQAGQLLNRVLSSLNIDRDSLYVTNTLKCRPKNNQLPKGKGAVQECVDACWPYLEEEIQSVDPKVILLMGGTSLVTLTGLRMVTRHEGMEIDTIYEGAKTFVALHPAYVLRSPSKEANLARAIALAAKAAGIKVRPKSIEEIDPYPYEVRV